LSKKTKGEIKNKKDDEIKRLKKHIKELEKAEAERKQAEKALKKSEKQYRSLVETIEEGVGNVDEKENFTLVNQAAADIFGYTKKEMIGKNLKEFTSLKMFQQILKQTSIRKKGESSSYEISILRKNGEERIVTVTATPIINKNGEHQGAFGIFHDITERKKAEQKLYESKERFRKIYEHMAVGIAQVYTSRYFGREFAKAIATNSR
jgi:PAS domain S-box-containing protein